MATIYINPDAGPGGTGTEAAPFDSWGDVTWVDGNTYLQRAGTSEDTNLVITEANVTLGSYGAGAKPVIQHTSGIGIRHNQAAPKNNLTIDGFKVDGDGTGTQGIVLEGGTGHSLSNLIIGNNTAQGIRGNQGPTFTLDGFSISDVGDDGIITFGGFPTIRNGSILAINTTNPTSGTGDCIQLSNTGFSITDYLIEHVRGVHRSSDKGAVFVDEVGSIGGTIRFCDFTAENLGISSRDLTGNVHDNIVRSAAVGYVSAVDSSTIKFWNNVTLDCAVGASAKNTSSTYTIYNNAFLNCTNHALDSNTTNTCTVLWRNNLCSMGTISGGDDYVIHVGANVTYTANNNIYLGS